MIYVNCCSECGEFCMEKDKVDELCPKCYKEAHEKR